MKILRIKTDNTVEALQYPEEKNIRAEDKKLREFIGEECGILERVRPVRLYEELGAGTKPTKRKGEAVNMLVDEEGMIKKLPINMVASWLYGADMHGHPIVGDVLIAGEYWYGDGISFCGLSEWNFSILHGQLQMLADMARKGSRLRGAGL